MLKRYSIWDKVSPVITPSGEVFTAEQWMTQYPVARIPSMVIVGSAGPINGGIFGVLNQMVLDYEARGCDFTGCTTDVERLERIETFEEESSVDTGESNAQDRIAAALEAIEMAYMPTTREDDPDLD